MYHSLVLELFDLLSLRVIRKVSMILMLFGMPYSLPNLGFIQTVEKTKIIARNECKYSQIKGETLLG